MVRVDSNDPANPQNKWRIHETQRQLRRILLAWDPIGVGNNPYAADEYDCLMGPLLRMLHEQVPPQNIRKWLMQQLKEHFGLKPNKKRETQLAEDLVQWWSRRSLETDRPPGASASRRRVGMADLRAALVRLSAGEQPPEELPDLAAYALVSEEVDSPSLRELAGLSASDVRESRELFLNAMEELGVQVPGERDAHMEMARFWAREMLAGSVSPYEASRLIWWRAWEPLDRPAELTAFVGLASEWEDDPEHRSQYEQDMVAEAQRLSQTPSCFHSLGTYSHRRVHGAGEGCT